MKTANFLTPGEDKTQFSAPLKVVSAGEHVRKNEVPERLAAEPGGPQHHGLLW